MAEAWDRPRRRVAYGRWIAISLGLLTLGHILTYLWAEGLWFQDLDYFYAYGLRVRMQAGLGGLAFLGSLAIALANLRLAQRLQFNRYCVLPNQASLRSGLGLRWLLPLGLGLGLLIGLVLIYHGQIAIARWELPQVSSALPPLPLWLNAQSVWQIIQQLVAQPWQGAIVIAVAISLLIRPGVFVPLSAWVLSVSFSLLMAEQWSRVLPAFNPTAFETADPVFGRDISFYIFRLPVLELLEFWLSGLLLFSLAAVALLYLLAGNSLSQGRFIGFSSAQQRHLYGLGGLLLLATAFNHWLTRYELLYSEQGVTYGASYTDIHVDLPVNTGLCLIALGLAVALLWRTVFWSQNPRKQPLRSRPLIGAVMIYLTFALVGNTAAPWLVQRLVVQPNELVRERPYIERTIAFTRAAFDLSNIQTEEFDPQGGLTAADLEDNDLTIRNIRVWDTRPLLESNRQLQQIRLYYEFADADVDRYTLIRDEGPSDRRQVLISARELNYERVPDIAKTWVNEHLIYTHGYGFTISPVNTAGAGGLPDYFIKDIAHTPSSPVVAQSIPVGAPRLYFGELTNTYIMTSTKVQELDYPSGSDNIYTTYAGQGGIGIGTFWRRLLFAKHLADWKMLLTEDFTPNTQLLYRRSIRERVNQIAPFLQFDGDPYLVVADAEGNFAPRTAPEDETGEAVATDEANYLYWMIDAYTTSDRYPYADPGENPFNYIRNSIKVVVDAYQGTVQFYVADESDPIIRTWASIFPNLFQPLAAMPDALLAHIRYPQDFSLIQSNQLLTYHMTDPQVFYNREDQWRAPTEIYANESQVVEPYYLIMELPGNESGEFVLLRPFTPAQRNNLIAWLAARSDGEQYGRQLLYRFPKQELVFGPEQIEARINQDPQISQRISLWDTQGSRANQGNLLVIPIEQSLLYVEPLYLEAEQNRLPILARVIVAYQNRIAMAETLDQSLDAIFRREETSSPAILRELDATEGIDELLLDDGESGSAGDTGAGGSEAE